MIKLPLSDGTDWSMPIQYECVLRENYHDIDKQFQLAYVWLSSNPQRRPTVKGVRRFCANWLAKHPELLRNKAVPLSVYRAEQPIDREAGRAKLAELRKLIKA